MEEGMRNPSTWKGLLRAEIGNLLYVDMTSGNEINFVGKCEELYRRIAGILHLETVPLIQKQEIVIPLNPPSKDPFFGTAAPLPPQLMKAHVTNSAPLSTLTPPSPVNDDEVTPHPTTTVLSNRARDCLKDSVILKEHTAVALLSLLPGSFSPTSLLYRGSRDGFDKGVYHTKCDNQGPHVTIVKCTDGYIFGGYMAVEMPTSASGAWVTDPSNTSFLFTLKHPKGEITKKYPLTSTNNIYALYSRTGYFGFCYGYDDISTNDMKNVKFRTSAVVTYDCCGEDNLRFTGKAESKIAEVEVWNIALPFSRKEVVAAPLKPAANVPPAVTSPPPPPVRAHEAELALPLSASPGPEMRRDCLKGSVILTEHTAVGVVSLLPDSFSPTALLYRGSRDGFDKNTFHAKCDKQGPLLTILKCSEGYVFGGYMSVEMPAAEGGAWIPDDSKTSFLFAFKGEVAKKYSIIPKFGVNYALYSVRLWGFCFGFYDMRSNDLKNVQFFDSSNYGVGEDKLRFTGKEVSKIAEIEVWKIEPPQNRNEEISAPLKSTSHPTASPPIQSDAGKLLPHGTGVLPEEGAVPLCLKDSIILTECAVTDLTLLFPPGVKSTSLLYRGSRDGFDKAVYHAKCDDQGSHLTIIKCSEGFIFGAYMAVEMPASASGKWVADDSNTSFLFRLKNPIGEPAKKYPIKDSNIYGLYSHTRDFGFCFGYNDITTFNMNIVRFGSSAIVTYDRCGEDNLRFTGKAESEIAEVEVWKVLF
jgi:hypothetical protein